MPSQTDAPQLQQRSMRESRRYNFLYYAISVGIAMLLAMLAIAFGPSAAIFGGILCAIVITLMARRYRFSLRAFLLVMTVLSVWLGLKLSQDIKMNRALSSITSGGGRLTMHDRRPNFPWGLWKNRYRLDYYGLKERLSEEDFSHLTMLAPTSLQWLDLSNTGVADNDLKSIEGCTHLEFLSLANATYGSGEVILNRPQNIITDAGLARLGQLRNLKGIDLSGTVITDEGLKVLSAMPNLKWIYLNGTKVTGAGIGYLGSHKHLNMLELNGCKMMPIGYQELIQLPNLNSLGLRNSGATDEDLALLEENTWLAILRLDNTSVSDEAVQKFQLTHPNCRVER